MSDVIDRRNVHVFSSSTGVEVAEFFQHGGVSISTFIGWINQVCSVSEEWALYPCKFDNNLEADRAALDSSSEDELQPGRYVIRSLPPKTGQVLVDLTTEVPRLRAYSVTSTPHDTNFMKRVRARDQRCCITGRLVRGDDYTGFEACHIFPPSETDTVRLNLVGCQIGNYRIYNFVDSDHSPHGNIFYRDPNEQRRYLPSPDLLRDHLRQCILRHVKGAGEVIDTVRRFDPEIDLGTGGFDLASGSWWSTSEGCRPRPDA